MKSISNFTSSCLVQAGMENYTILRNKLRPICVEWESNSHPRIDLPWKWALAKGHHIYIMLLRLNVTQTLLSPEKEQYVQKTLPLLFEQPLHKSYLSATEPISILHLRYIPSPFVMSLRVMQHVALTYVIEQSCRTLKNGIDQLIWQLNHHKTISQAWSWIRIW